MNKHVLISITGVQNQGSEQDSIELMTTGTYYHKNGTHYVFYEEQPEDSGQIIKNRLKFDHQRFEMTKTGGRASHMFFDLSEAGSNYYDTPAGPILMDVTTKKYELSIEEHHIDAFILYTLIMNNQYVTNCGVKVRIEDRKEKSDEFGKSL